MIYFTVYNPSTGEILRTGACNDEDFSLQGEYVIEGIFEDSKYYIENGQPVEIPAQPTKWHFFDYSAKEWVLNFEFAATEIRQQRKLLLKESDWTQLPNGPLSAESQAQWAAYRQELRDLTDQEGFPLNVVWPSSP